MVTLQTMDTSAAPMAPMMAAALPPPGVGWPLARSSRNFSTEAWVTIVSPLRSLSEYSDRLPDSTDHRFGDGINLLGIEQQVVLVEQTRDAGAMQGELERTEAEGAEEYLATLFQAAVARAHALDSSGGRCIGVGNQFQCAAAAPLLFIQERNPGGAGGKDDVGALDGGAALGIGGCLDGASRDAEARLQGVAGGLH